MSKKQADMILVGAGLSGLLTAWRCLDVNPDLTIMVIETTDRIAGDHTWSFNLTDVDESLRCLLYTSPSPRDATLSRMPSSA